ncbi:Gfo/Idh/MocA family oxidoreductase [Acidobacteria bacterium AH-259-O06]|nr:Gfo/Idh/MocA family oxidoreductase [Acidobacteria bacterium AH-259-O06]
MKFLVVGLGSMGKRRIRCFKALGHEKNVFGFDLRSDRRLEVEQKYGAKTYADFSQAVKEVQPNALIISVPPDHHHQYMKFAAENRCHFFVEASVVDTDLDHIKELSQKAKIVAAPSATLGFHPAIRQISEIVKSGQLGKISNIMLHSGQYLPDWHIYEQVSDYYVSNPATGGAREIVPFELTWVTHLFGFPKSVTGYNRRTVTIKGAEKIDDTYNFLLEYDNCLASITIDVVSRFATRRLLINGDQRQLVWDWTSNMIRIYDPQSSQWTEIPYEMGSAAPGYNANIGENMYIDELRSFLTAIETKNPFVNTLENDHKVLKLLYTIEESDKKSQHLPFQE